MKLSYTSNAAYPTCDVCDDAFALPFVGATLEREEKMRRSFFKGASTLRRKRNEVEREAQSLPFPSPCSAGGFASSRVVEAIYFYMRNRQRKDVYT